MQVIEIVQIVSTILMIANYIFVLVANSFRQVTVNSLIVILLQSIAAGVLVIVLEVLKGMV